MIGAALRRRPVDVALAMLAVAAVVAVVLTRRSLTAAEAEARARHVMVAFRAEEISRLVLEQGRERVVLERGAVGTTAREPGAAGAAGVGDEASDGDAEWRIVEPRVSDVGTAEVRALLDALGRAVFVRRLAPEEVDRPRFGLDSPRAVATLTMGASSYRLLLGGEAVSPPGSAYLEVTGEGAVGRGVGIVRGDTAAALLLGVDALRDPRLAPYFADDLARVVLTAGAERTELTRTGGRWRVVTAAGERLADRNLVDALFLQLVRLDAETPVRVDDARRLLGPAPLRLELVPTDGRARARLELGGRCPHGDGLVALRSEPDPRAGCAPEDVRRVLDLPRERWVSRRPLGFSPDEVESVRIDRGSQRLELVRSEAGYRLRVPRVADVDLDTGNRRVLSLLDVRGEPVEDPDLGALGLAPPAGTVTVESSAATEAEVITEILDVGVPDRQGSLVVRRRLDGVVLRLDREASRAFLPDATLVRPRSIFDFAAGSVRRVEVTGGEEQILVQPRPGAFALERPAGFAVDGGLAADLVDSLARLEAERWVADQDDGSFGLARPALRVRLVVEREPGAEVVRELRLGDGTTGGVFAAVEGEEGVFVLSRRVRSSAERLLIDRSLLPGAPDALAEVAVESPTASLVLTRIGSGWQQTSGAPRLDPADVVRLGEALESLRAEAAVHLGEARPEEGLAAPQLTLRLRPAPGSGAPRTIRLGAGDSWQGTSVLYARVDGVAATFVVARGAVAAILDAL